MYVILNDIVIGKTDRDNCWRTVEELVRAYYKYLDMSLTRINRKDSGVDYAGVGEYELGYTCSTGHGFIANGSCELTLSDEQSAAVSEVIWSNEADRRHMELCDEYSERLAEYAEERATACGREVSVEDVATAALILRGAMPVT